MVDPDAANESDDPYDGAFSYAAEGHAFTHGVYDGMKNWRVRPKQLPDNDDVQKEPHYYKGGYVIGTLLQVGVVCVIAYAGL